MAKKYMVLCMVAVFATTIAKANIDNYTPTLQKRFAPQNFWHGLLAPQYRGTITSLQTGQNFLIGVITGSGTVSNTLISITAYPASSIKKLILTQITVRVGRDPDTQLLSDDEAVYAINTYMTAEMVKSIDFWQAGNQSFRVSDNGEEGLCNPLDFEEFDANSTELIFFINGVPAFRAVCMNPIKVPQTPQPTPITQPNPQYPQGQQQMYYTGGVPIIITNNNTNTNTFPATSGGTQYVVEKEKGNGWAVVGAALLGGVTGYFLGRGHQPYYSSGYYGNYNRYPPMRGGGWHQGGGGGTVVTPPPVRHYNTSTLNPIPAGYYGRPRSY